jgi:hypothetical protein
MRASKRPGSAGGRSRAAWARAAALLGLLLSGRALAITSQDFQTPGTAYQATTCSGATVPAVLAGGPGGTGNFLRLLTQADVSALNTAAFDRSDPGGFVQATVDFDFRITPGPSGRGEGFGFALLNTGPGNASGSFCKIKPATDPDSMYAEEPNLPGSLGIGFDVKMDAGEINSNHVSVHWNGALVQELDAGAVDLAAGTWIHAHILARPKPGQSDISIQLTPFGGATTVLATNLSIPTFQPFEARAFFGARSSTVTADYDLANVQVQFASDPSVLGQWSAAIPLPIVPIHSVMMPSGKIICWDRSSNGGTDTTPRLIDPNNSFAVTATPNPGVEIFCCGMTLRHDGKLLQAGGHLNTDGNGIPSAFIYDEVANVWTQLQNMNAGRWYPTLTNLNNGDSVVMSGVYNNGANNNTLPQVIDGVAGTWRSLTTAVKPQSNYPMVHLAPNGMVYQSGPDYDTYYLDTSGTGAWQHVADSSETTRNYGNSVLYGTGKIVLIGGGGGVLPVHNSVEVIDLTSVTPPPAWRVVAPMTFARRHQSALLLPDGTILVTGGTPSNANFNDATNAVLAAELWDPVLESWKVLSACAYFRLYHSETVLLQDGRVASLGGGHPSATNGGSDNYNLEVFTPPYLLNGLPRPTLTSAPAIVAYSQQFVASSPDGANITDVTLLALNAMTHAFDMNQRILHPSFTKAAGGVTITAPNNANLCPPGYYQLFLLMNGVPSVSKIIHIAPDQPPTAVATASATTVEATGATGASVQLDGSGSSDPEGLISKYEWFDGGAPLALGVNPTVVLGVGVHNITLKVTDGGGFTSTVPLTVTVTDTTPPVVQNLSASPNLLRSVTDTMVAVTLSGTATDLVSGSLSPSITQVASNEPDPTGNPGDQSPDFSITGAMTVNLRAERFTYVRVYTVTVSATDGAGNTGTATVPVRVRGKWFP